MKRQISGRRILAVAAVSALVGAVFGTGCLAGLANVNPCGTVLSTNFCDPQQYAFVFGDIFDPKFPDPTCTVPFSCTGTFPPTGNGN